MDPCSLWEEGEHCTTPRPLRYFWSPRTLQLLKCARCKPACDSLMELCITGFQLQLGAHHSTQSTGSTTLHDIGLDGHSASLSYMLQVFILIPNTPANLGMYASWHGMARQAGVFLPEHASGAGQVSVEAGATLFIPGKLISAAAGPLYCWHANRLGVCALLVGHVIAPSAMSTRLHCRQALCNDPKSAQVVFQSMILHLRR